VSSHERFRHLAEQLASGGLSVDEFLKHAAVAPSQRLGSATIDHDRSRRCGFPEVVFSEGKSLESLRAIFEALLSRQVEVLATRIDAPRAAALREAFPNMRFNELARTVRILPSGRESSTEQPPKRGKVAIITAGTSDQPVAEEARETADWMGVGVVVIHDVGVAGPHRLPERLAEFQDADAIVVVAGMEGALPSVVAGYVPCPVIAVPTSVGYGASFGGVAALLSMLNSCASNVAVVNIDAGFKAGYLAGLIATRAARQPVARGVNDLPMGP
jgi:NCAIR mutase (PurE)-related protein